MAKNVENPRVIGMSVYFGSHEIPMIEQFLKENDLKFSGWARPLLMRTIREAIK